MHQLSVPPAGGETAGRAGSPQAWQGAARLRFQRDAGGITRHQGGATAPLKVQRAFLEGEGRCQLPLLHTAGGLVGGDGLSLTATLEEGSRALLTSVAAQKVYGSVGRSRRSPEGAWASQRLRFALAAAADLEWLPQELVLYAGGLYEQSCRVDLEPGASWLGAEVVRLGLTAAGEDLGEGRWRSSLEIRRGGSGSVPGRWELVERLELGGEALSSAHGMAGQPVLGSLVWAAPERLDETRLSGLLEACRADRDGLPGDMACGPLEQGLLARYRGPSSMAARHWFTRIWRRIRAVRGLAEPVLPRVWPFQEDPLAAAVSPRSTRPGPSAPDGAAREPGR